MQLLGSEVSPCLLHRPMIPTYHDPISMATFVLPKLLPAAKACGTYVYTVPDLANRVGTFDSDGMSEVAGAAVTFDLQARFAHSYIT